MSSIATTLAALAGGTLSAESLVEQARERAQRAADLNALAYVDWDGALADARDCDARARSGGGLRALHGLPITIKDLFNVRGMPTRAGTRAPLPELEAG
ncbi:MAG: amidase, partial [Limnobacter sp.]|nr:amidase [Limnobacter sp.]